MKCLKGLTRAGCFDDDQFVERRFLEENAENGLGQAMFHVLRVQTAVLLGQPDRAAAWAERAQAWLPYLRTLLYRVELHFYMALALVDDPARRAQVLEHLRRLEEWAEGAQANLGHKRDLVAAELARVDERPADAIALYHRAIEQAGAGGMVQDEAIAHERCGRFHAARGAERMAAVHLSAAVDAYARWGASAKVGLLRAEFPSLELGGRLRRATTPPAPIPGLDYLTLLKVAETLTEELVFDRLLEKLVCFCTEAADAQRGVLILDENGLVVRAGAVGREASLEKTPLVAARDLPVSLVEHVFRSRELLLLGDAARESRFSADPHIAGAGVRSVLAVPLCRKDRTLGLLYFENNLVSDAFSSERAEMFRLLSAELVIAIENSRLFEARKRSEAALRLLSDASARLGETLDYERVVATIGEVTVPHLADWCLVEAFDDGAMCPVALAHADPQRRAALEELQRRYPADSRSAMRFDVLRSGQSLLIEEVTDQHLRSSVSDADNLKLLQALAPQSLLVIPLKVRGRTLGVATFGSSQSMRRYDAADLALADELVRRIGLAIENARLHRDLDRTLREREARDRFLRVVFRTMPGAVWAFDRELRFTYASGTFYGARGIDPEKLAGATLYDFLQTRDPTDSSIAHHLGALAGKRQSFEYRFHHRWYDVRIEPLRREGQVIGCVGVAFDITEKRAAAERLAKSEARLWEAQAVAHIGSFEWDIAPNTVTWTDELHRIYGLEPGEFAGSFEAFLGMVHPDELESTKNVIFDAYRAGRPFTYDHRIVRKGGAVRILHTRGDVIKDAQGKPVRMVGTCWDVTELVEANRAREHTLSLLRATIEATADGIVVVDREHRLSAHNQRFASMWHIPQALAERGEEEPIIETMLEQLEDPDEFLRGMRERHAHPETESIDVLRFRDGRVLERYSRAQRVGEQIVGTVWSFRDISERERLLRRALFLADASRLLVSLDVEQALEGVAHLGVPFLGDGCAIDLFGNGGPRRLVAISRDPRRPITPELHPSVLGGNSIVYQVGTVSYLGVPLMMKGGLGGAITVCAPLHRRYGQADLELVEELSRRAALAVENSRLYQKSQEALRARDEFLAIAAHEIRGPVTSIHLAVQSLSAGVLPKEALPKLLQVVQQEDRRLSQFTNELLDLGRMRGGLRLDYESVDLVAVVREVTTRLGPEISRSGSALTLTSQGSVVGQWDKFRLDQVVTNLLTNAIKFGLGNAIEITIRTHDGRAVLVVKDHGIGIPREVQARIFRPFERGVSVRHYGGLGLGLHIVKTIVEALGGAVNVESEPGIGSIFTVVLPQARR